MPVVTSSVSSLSSLGSSPSRNSASTKSFTMAWIWAASDTLATSFALATALETLGKEHPIDIVFTGKQTIDGDTAQVGPGIAKRLDLKQLTYVSRIVDVDLTSRSIVAERRAEGGVQVLMTQLPALVTMLEGTNEIRRGSLDDALRAARADVVVWSAADAGISDLQKCGLRGSPTVVKRVFAPPPRSEKAELVETHGRAPAESADALIDIIFARAPGVEADLAKSVSGF